MKLIKGRREVSLGESGSFHIPFGLVEAYGEVVGSKSYVLFKAANNAICVDWNGKIFQLYPSYSKRVKLSGSSLVLTFSIVNSEFDRRSCQELLLKEHYLLPPNRGVYFVLKHETKVVACCVLDFLNFGNPRGRYFIDEQTSKGCGLDVDGWGAASLDKHKELQEQLNLIWVSRIARDEEYSSHRLGTVLIDELLKALPSALPNKYKYVEIIRTLPVGDDRGVDFLCGLGFRKILLSTENSLVPPGASKEFHPKPQLCEKVYYWKEIFDFASVDVDRVFIPLSTEPFNWFSSGKKKWELRRLGGQYTYKNIYAGRVVELRKGYRSSEALWGVINSVVTAVDIRSIFEAIGDYKAVVPVCDSLGDAVILAESIVGLNAQSGYIAFCVVDIVNVEL